MKKKKKKYMIQKNKPKTFIPIMCLFIFYFQFDFICLYITSEKKLMLMSLVRENIQKIHIIKSSSQNIWAILTGLIIWCSKGLPIVKCKDNLIIKKNFKKSGVLKFVLHLKLCFNVLNLFFSIFLCVSQHKVIVRSIILKSK